MQFQKKGSGEGGIISTQPINGQQKGGGKTNLETTLIKSARILKTNRLLAPLKRRFELQHRVAGTWI